jgi:alcohol dehydrogenase class IV
MLPHVIRHNGRHVNQWYCELAESNGVLTPLGSHGNAADALADFVAQISRRAGLAGTLTECNISRSDLPQLAAAATKQWTGKYNPLPLTESDFQKLYETAI